MLRDHFRARQIIVSPAPFRSRIYRNLIAKLEKTPVQALRVQRGDHVGRWTVLHPAADDRFPQGANNAMVLRGEFEGTRVLLVSDLGRLGQRALLGRESEMGADVVIAGLAGESDAIGDSLVRAANPRLLVVACAELPASSAPTRKLRERLSGLGVPVIYTSDTGAALLNFRRGSWTLRTMSGGPIPSVPGKADG